MPIAGDPRVTREGDVLTVTTDRGTWRVAQDEGPADVRRPWVAEAVGGSSTLYSDDPRTLVQLLLDGSKQAAA